MKQSLATVVVVSALVVLPAAVFWGCLSNPFHFDDHIFLDSPHVSVPGDPFFLLRPAQTRQLTYLTFYWSYRLSGADPTGYHLVNLSLHIANTLLVYLFIRLLTEASGAYVHRLGRHLPVFAAAAIFALHPIQSEAVNYAYQRSTLLAGFFSLLALNCYFWSEKHPEHAGCRLLWVPFWLLAAMSKESAWVLPLVPVAWIWTRSEKGRFFRNLLARSNLPLAVSWLLMSAGILWAYYVIHSSPDRTIGSPVSMVSVRYLAAQAQVFPTYLRLLLFPSGLSVDHDFKVSPVLSSYGLLCLGAAAGVLLVIFWVRKSSSLTAFFGVTFLILLTPTSSILSAADLLFEHRMYLPMIAAAPLLSFAVLSLGRSFRAERLRRGVLWGVLGIVLAGYAALTRERTYIWGDNVRLWADAVSKAPLKARTHYNLGVACLDRDRNMARREFLEVTRLSPRDPAAAYNLGWIDQREGRYDQARARYMASVEFDPGNWRAHMNLGNINLLQGRPSDALAEYREVLRLNPDYGPAHESLAALQVQLMRH